MSKAFGGVKKKKKDTEEHQLKHHNPVMEHPEERKRSHSRALIIFLHYECNAEKGAWLRRKVEAYMIYCTLTGQDLEW